MKKSILLTIGALLATAGSVSAQRVVDVLDRGLVAVKTTGGVLCTWRIPGEEWYDVQYNVYRDGAKLNQTPLDVSNYVDPDGNVNSTYTVTAVVRGVEQPQCAPVKVWEKNYMTIVPRHDPSLTSTYVPNDACVADVDGDGQVEILMKYDNQSEIEASYPYGGHNGEYSLFECLKLDGTVLWWVNCGPNMGDFQNNEQNIVGYDWDMDGKAEVVFRAADGTTIHMADGTVYTVGDASLNYRASTGGGANWFMHAGREYLLYVDGATGRPYVDMEYPLPRLEADENPDGLLSGGAYDGLVNQAWGDGYGHRSTKHFFGAPYLDGRHPSIFLARGIYTRHKMVAYDVDPATHQLIERWRWTCTDGGSPWHGQGYHNYSVADVDWDGRDEIVFGSMVIDDTGLGLSTTGLGHGDSQHVGDFDPYSHGQEVFACNEDRPNNNFRDATTSKLYYRTTGGNDDGRANMGNFIDEYPGAQGLSSRDDNLIGGASHAAIIGSRKGDVSITQNFRIYWDGDLCDESFDYNSGKNSQGAIFKARQGRIAILEGSRTNNDTKGTPCLQGDIFGDWREEVIMRDASNNIRIYTTDIPTPWRNYTLWHDPQYRNAMVWQMCGYNQTPHVSYFVGEYEGITEAPSPNIMTGRTEVANNGTIGADANDKHVVVCETNNMTVNVADGAKPYILTVNTPSWVKGHDSNTNITTLRYTHTLTGGAFGGDMRLIKQGDGTLALPAVVQTYTGETRVWAGALTFDGTLQNSPLWLNRFGVLNTTGGRFLRGIDMHYASVLNIGDGNAASTVTTTTLDLGFGAIVELDLFGDLTSDCIKADVLRIERKDWINGPEYLAPIVRLTGHNSQGESLLTAGTYLIGEIGAIEGSLDDLILQGLDNQKKALVYADGKLYIEITNFETGLKTWTGRVDGAWDMDNSTNFVGEDGQELTVFVPGDEVVFDDTAENTKVNIVGKLAPASVTFNNNDKDYTIGGEGRIVGATSLVKNGAGRLTINNINEYTGGTFINGGTLVAGVFSNEIGTDLGALSGIDSRITINNNAILSASDNATLGQRIVIQTGHGTIDVPNNVTLTLSRGVTSTDPFQVLTKVGGGTLSMGDGNTVGRLVIDGGTVHASEANGLQQLPKTVEFVKGTLRDADNIYSYSTNSAKIVVAEGNSGTWYLDSRCNYTGTLTGAGSLTVYATSVRNYLQGDWSAFTGRLSAAVTKTGSYDPVFIWSNNYGMPKATLNINPGCTFDTEGRNLEVGNLTGSGVLRMSGTLTVGGANEAPSFTGTYEGNPAMVKVGEGEWKVTRVIKGLGSLTVRGGKFSLAGSNINTNICLCPLTIDGPDALMRGRGTVTSLAVTNGGLLVPGYYDDNRDVHYGPVYVQGDVNVDEASTVSFYIRKADGTTNSRSFVSATGSITINGKVTVDLDPTWTPKAGDVIDLWDTKTFAGTPEIVLPELPTGLAWDTTGLKDATGELRVTVDSGVTAIDADAVVTCHVYATNGVLVATFEATRAQAVAAVSRLPIPAGAYIVTMTAGRQTESITVTR